MNQARQLDNLLVSLLDHLSETTLLIEAGLVLVLAVAAWFGVGLLRRRLARTTGAHPALSDPDWNRLMLPAALLLLVLVSRAGLSQWQNVPLLNLVVPLLMAFLAIRICLYLLRRILKPSPKLHTLEHLVSWLAWGILALHITGHLDNVAAAMDGVSLSIGRQRISLYTVLMGLLSLAATLMLALWLARVVETRLIEAMPITANMRLALTKLARSLFVLVAVLIALPLVGIDITVLSVFGGALGVGLGLGLQKIAANYVSGFTLLLDQSIRIGDMVSVGPHNGVVSKIATRYTVIRGLDGTENIIPNETMITSPVVNHSLSDKDNLVMLPIQVAYDTDLNRVREILLDLARTHARVLAAHDPQVRLKDFGENGIDLVLAVWIADPEEGELSLRSDLNWAIWEAFRREGIEIPYPQRVVHMVQNPMAQSDRASL